MPIPAPRSLAALFVAALLAGCGGGDDEEPDITAPERAEGTEVELEVVEGRRGSVLAFAPVFIGGEGPFAFALDTGASQSVIDKTIVEDLGIEIVGSAGPVTGVTGTVQAEIVNLKDWRIGQGVDLDETEITTIDLPDPRGGQTGLRGLLGSDILSNFGAIAVDYESETLVLTPRDGG